MRKAITALAVSTLALALTACGSSDETTETTTATEATPTSTQPAEPEVHSLSDTVSLGSTVTISDLEVTTEGCEFTDPPTRDAVKFQIIATVENNTGEDILEVLWPTEITFTDPDGFSISSLDIAAPGEGPCVNDIPREFNSMSSGEKRRAAVTLEAPAGAQEMIYNTTLIEGAEPVRWDISEEVANMEVVSSTQQEAPAPTAPEAPSTPTPPTPAPAPQQPPVVGMTEAPGAAQPSAMNKTVESCGDPTMHQRGTTFFTDGTSGWTRQCANQMGQ